MVAPLSPSARLKSLKNDYGATHGENAPTSWLVAFYDDFPEFGGVELNDTDCPGYARIAVAQAEFEATANNSMSAIVAPDEATDVWTRPARVAAMLNADDPDEIWDYTPIASVMPKDDGTFDPVEIEIFYTDDTTSPE